MKEKRNLKKDDLKKEKFNKGLNIAFAAILVIVSVTFLVQLVMMDKLPMLYLGIIALILILICAGLVAIQLTKKINKTNKTLGKIIIAILSVLLIVGNVFLYKTNHTFNGIVDTDKKDIQISVLVLKDSPVQAIEDLSQTVGVVTIGNTAYVDKTIDEMKKVNDKFNIKQYIGFDKFGDALYNGEVEAIVVNDAFIGQFEENHPNFVNETRIIKTYGYEEEKKDISKNVNVTENTFTVYISGIDQRGTINTLGRSDVNKILTINPKTHQIFILDIPRDYYVAQVCQANQLDKLTHTGIFGVDCTVESMSNYMGIDINYYVRINFSSLERIVDALGGIDVESVYDFSVGGYHYNVGMNHLNGEEALAFSRERYSFGGGDGVRIENQTRVLKAMIDKVTSPAIITNYLSFMDAINGTFQTNMNEKELNALIKMQLNDMKGWTITSDHLSGKGASDWTPANGFNAYVMYPDGTSRERALEKIQKVMNGEPIK